MSPLPMLRPATWPGAARRAGWAAQRRLGRAGLVGLVLAAASLAAAMTVARIEADARRFDDEGRRLQQALAAADRSDASPVTPREQLQRFQAWFPPLSQGLDDLRAVFAAAGKHGVMLAKGEYTVKRADDGSRIARVQALLPVSDGYPKVKAFVGEVLNTLPHASLTELRLERGASGPDRLEARVLLTLFYREP